MLAHGLIATAQRDVDIATIGILQVSQPALAVAWSYVLLGEASRWAQVPGMVLVLVGLAAFTWVSQRRTDRVQVDQHGELTGSVG
jgi:drug/metabolite transporter (DMT)-like permease